ncbi:MarR family winged helix-turn-helix transcriptional regulator [Catenulispora pinisilvae]|uniref:MarR family winged helix-turn-helix transcriptional regulator n=1 Tax=Catenulispora pinisilvae TaxID=2705253 RepID=UPI002B27B824|nr:MarR family transcriptional regulator [Catenulispora pinisilvae]
MRSTDNRPPEPATKAAVAKAAVAKASAADAAAADAALTDAGIEELAQVADALFLAMRRSRASYAQRDGGLSFPQLTLLEPLMREKRMPVGRLAAGADVSVPTATRMLKQLEAKGLVVRERSTEDERQVLISLTEDGAGRLATMRGRLRERQARSFEVFTPQERVQFVTLTRRLTEFITDAVKAEGAGGDGIGDESA